MQACKKKLYCKNLIKSIKENVVRSKQTKAGYTKKPTNVLTLNK